MKFITLLLFEISKAKSVLRNGREEFRTVLSEVVMATPVNQVEEKGSSQAWGTFARFRSVRMIAKARTAIEKKGYKIG